MRKGHKGQNDKGRVMLDTGTPALTAQSWASYLGRYISYAIVLSGVWRRQDFETSVPLLLLNTPYPSKPTSTTYLPHHLSVSFVTASLFTDHYPGPSSTMQEGGRPSSQRQCLNTGVTSTRSFNIYHASNWASAAREDSQTLPKGRPSQCPWDQHRVCEQKPKH